MDNEIAQIVSDWVNQKRAFTAYEVTLELRRRGFHVRHAYSKPQVHHHMQPYSTFGSYGVTDVVVSEENGTPVYAMLYHHVTYDPSCYVGIGRSKSYAAPTPSVNSIVAVAATTVAASYANGVLKSVDKRSALLIPNTILKEAGIKPEQKVYVCTDPSGSIIITLEPTDKMVAHGTYTVDDNNNVRITQHCLMKAGAPGSTYEVLGGKQVKIKRIA